MNEVAPTPSDDASPEAVPEPRPGSDPAEPLPEAQPEASTICDGSDAMRFVFVSAGGYASDAFMAHNGDRYVAIDGRCEYWLGEAQLRGLRHGALDRERAQALASELHYGEYASVAAYRGAGCDDCGTIIVVDDTGKIVSDGSGSPGAVEPPVWTAAMAAAGGLFEELQAGAEPASTTKTLLAIRTERASVVGTVPLDLGARALEPDSFWMYERDSAYWVTVEDASTLGVLDELRRSALQDDPSAHSLFVEDASGGHFELLVRDEPPAPVARALADAQRL